MRPELSVVIPMYNEQEVLPLLAQRLRPVLDAATESYEVVCVDDGSRDLTPALLHKLDREWEQVRVVRLRANAGHQAAISAGLSVARGRYVVTIDADLQDPPEVIAEMLATARREGVDVVYGVRSDRSTDTAFKRGTARAFYSIIRRISGTSAQADAGDFRLMSRATVDAINTLPDTNRVLRFVVPALGFPSASVGYRREARAAGESKYPFLKMLRLSLDAVTGFSLFPLRLATYLGLVSGVLMFLAAIGLVVASRNGQTIPGWTSTVVIVAAVGSVQLVCLGLLGEYVGRMYTQLQGRPAYFIASDSGAETAPVEPGPAQAAPAHAALAQAVTQTVPAPAVPAPAVPAPAVPARDVPAPAVPAPAVPAPAFPAPAVPAPAFPAPAVPAPAVPAPAVPAPAVPAPAVPARDVAENAEAPRLTTTETARVPTP